MNPRIRRRCAAGLAMVATVAWPVTQLTIARGEPPFTLGLSWFAVVLASLDIWATTDVRAESDNDDSGD